MKRSCIIIFVFIILLANNNFVLAQNDRNEFEPKLSGKLFDQDPRIMGSQFFLEHWVKSDVKLSNGVVLKNKLLNYNGYLNKFIWINDLNLSVILDDYLITEVKLYIDSLNAISFTKIYSTKDSLRVFAELISDDKIKLYAHRQVIKDQDVDVSKGENYYRKILVKNQPIYFLNFPNQRQIIVSRLTSRNIIRAFPANEQQIVKDILHKHRLRIKSEKDLIRFNFLLGEVFIN